MSGKAAEMVELGVFLFGRMGIIITKTFCRNYGITWRGCGDGLRPGCRGISRLGPQKGCQFGPLALDFSSFQGPLQEINILLTFNFELTWNIPIHNGIPRASRFTTLAPKNQVFSHPSGQSHLQWNWWARRIVWKPKDCGLRGLILGVNRSTDMASRCGIQHIPSGILYHL